jgi:hypothetical protein
MDYVLTARMPDIRLPIDVTGTLEYVEWITTPAAGIWFLLHSKAVRARFKSKKLGTYIYDKYYTNGMVVSFLTQKEIKKILWYSSKGYISNMLSTLCEQEVIKEHRDKFNGRSIKLYQTAEVLDVENQLEAMFVVKFLRRQIAKNKLAKFE